MTARRFATPAPIAVVATTSGAPARFRWRGRWWRVAAILATWEIETDWWLGSPAAVARRYHRLRTTDGLLCVAYRDQHTGHWFLEQITD